MMIQVVGRMGHEPVTFHTNELSANTLTDYAMTSLKPYYNLKRNVH